jgi:hypothetical protein
VLFHRYAIDAEGLITSARIVPPTSQNQASIEDDLRRFVAGRLDLDDQQLTSQCEQAIRNYDPCISCATHFLDLTMDRADPPGRMKPKPGGDPGGAEVVPDPLMPLTRRCGLTGLAPAFTRRCSR